MKVTMWSKSSVESITLLCYSNQAVFTASDVMTKVKLVLVTSTVTIDAKRLKKSVLRKSRRLRSNSKRRLRSKKKRKRKLP